MNTILEYLPHLNTIEIIGHLSIMIINISLFFYARKILTKLLSSDDDHKEKKIKGFKIFNILFAIMHFIEIMNPNIENNIIINIGKSIIYIYFAYILHLLFSFSIRYYFNGIEKIDNIELAKESYETRMFSFLFGIFISFIVFYYVISMFVTNESLENGIYGFLAGAIILSVSVWLPNLFYGFLMLSSKNIEMGDIVQFEKENNYYIIYKTHLMYTILFDISNNHRVVILNSNIMNKRIGTLTKKANTDGYREFIEYKIGYPNVDYQSEEERVKALSKFQKEINNLFKTAYENAILDENIHLLQSDKTTYELFLINAGDYALEYRFYFYINSFDKTLHTHKARQKLKSVPLLNQKVYEASVRYNINLSTSDKVDNNIILKEYKKENEKRDVNSDNFI